MSERKIIYVVENKKWVQAKRFEVIKRFQKKYSLKIITARYFYFLWIFGMHRNDKIIFSTWRIVHNYLKKNKNIFKNTDYQNFLASVTSHSNIGGGLDPLNPIPGRTPEEAYELSTNLLLKFKVVTVNSKILYDYLKKKLPKIIYCPNGVDINFFNNNNNKTYDPKNIIIGWVGKIRGPKNYQLIQKIKKNLIKEKNVSIEVISVEKNINFVPNNKEGMYDFYKKIDFYLCVSFNEGTPNPALEAASCGVPIISTKVGNMPELIEEHINGFFIEPDEHSVMKKINFLKTLSIEEYDLMSKNIRDKVENFWSWNKRIKNFVNSYDILTK